MQYNLIQKRQHKQHQHNNNLSQWRPPTCSFLTATVSCPVLLRDYGCRTATSDRCDVRDQSARRNAPIFRGGHSVLVDLRDEWSKHPHQFSTILTSLIHKRSRTCGRIR